MSEWRKVVITILCSALGSALSASLLVWNLLQDHESKLRVLEVKLLSVKENVDAHVARSSSKYDFIVKKLTEIQVDIGRIQGAKDGR